MYFRTLALILLPLTAASSVSVRLESVCACDLECLVFIEPTISDSNLRKIFILSWTTFSLSSPYAHELDESVLYLDGAVTDLLCPTTG